MALIESAFIDLGIATAIALLVLLVVRFLKQPIIVGYIIVGIISSPLLLNLFSSNQSFAPLASLGVSLLLFVVGLNLNPKIVKDVKKTAIITGFVQLLFILGTGFFIARLLGFGNVTAVFIALALSLSSTIVIMKFLSDKEETETVYGRIVVGFLLLQDLVHILVLVALKMFGEVKLGMAFSNAIVETLLKGATIVVALFIVAIYILPSVTKTVAKSQELLLLFSIAWALAISSIFELLNFTAEVGALVAGIALSFSQYKYEISSKMKPFRDFFLLIFFIWVGTQIEPISLKEYALPIVSFSLLVLIGSPVIVMTVMGYLGYTKRNSFLTGLTIAQISEFSFIIVAVGVIEGFVQPGILTMIITIGLITIAGSSYAIEHSNKLYISLSKYLNLFERRGIKIDEGKYHKEKDYDIILFGYNRIGYSLKNSFHKLGKKFLIIDNNPEIIQNLAKSGIDCRYGDAEDLELLSELPLKKAKLIVSTIPEFEVNILLIEKIREINKDAIAIVVSHQIEEALQLYNVGATYVISPHFLGGAHASHLIEKYSFDINKFTEEGKRSIQDLLRRKEEGHKSVIHERD